jgi:carboxyl-terminal processing protease
MLMKKRILSLLIAVLTVMSVTLMPIFAITDAEAEAKATELLTLIILGNEYSTLEDGGGTIYAMYPALVEAIKKDPSLYDKLYKSYFDNSDAYTRIYSEEQYQANIYGTETVGIGLSFMTPEDPTENGMIVSAVVSDSPADKAGIKKGDTVIAVNGEDISKLPFAEAYTKVIPLAKEKGKAFTLTIKTADGKTKDVKITPAVINSAVSSVTSGIVETDRANDVGYIKISDFLIDTPQYFEVALDEFEKRDVKSLVIDLRGNLGGESNSVYECLNMIIPAEVPMYSMTQSSGLSLTTSDDTTDYAPDIVVLVDNDTASASEVFAAVLQYHDIARLVGERTYGKAIGQINFDLGNGKYFALTALECYLPNGKNWQGKGLTPDVKAVDDLKTADIDEAFDAAVKILDDTGFVPKEAATFDYYFDNIAEDSIVEISDIALGADKMWPKDVRYIYRSKSGIMLTINCRDAYEAIKLYWYTGFYDTAKYKAALDKAGYKNFEVIGTHQDDFGFDAQITMKTDVDAKYFYYWNTEDGTYEAFTGKPIYQNGTLTFTTKKGGVIIAAEEKLF